MNRNSRAFALLISVLCAYPGAHASTMDDIRQALAIKELEAFNIVRAEDLRTDKYPVHLENTDGMTPEQITKASIKADRAMEKQERKIAHQMCLRDPEYMRLKIAGQSLRNQAFQNYMQSTPSVYQVNTLRTAAGSQSTIYGY